MKKLVCFPVLLAVLAVVSSGLLSGCVASAPPATAAVVVRPRPYYRPAPVVVVAPRRTVIVKPAPRRFYGRWR